MRSKNRRVDFGEAGGEGERAAQAPASRPRACRRGPRPRCGKAIVKGIAESFVNRRIGALQNKYAVGSHYEIKLAYGRGEGPPARRTADSEPGDASSERIVNGVQFEYRPVPLSKPDRPGVYALRTNVLTMEGKEIWHAYVRLTSVESVFRSLKSDLGLRPNYHSAEKRILGHAFISVLAYRAVNWIRNKLKANGINDSWDTIVDWLMDVNCKMALGANADAAEEAGRLYPEVEQARRYFKAIGLDKPAPLIRCRFGRPDRRPPGR